MPLQNTIHTNGPGEHSLSEPYYQGVDRLATADSPELAVKLLRGFVGIAIVVFNAKA